MIAADNAKFSYPEAGLGFTGGMIAGLAGRIPPQGCHGNHATRPGRRCRARIFDRLR
ncbi:MAG: hypothetical protein M5U30_11755 [Burkholderiaceae bacterium]|nr:hypothetical protein [Burkholderiaceae bacterium]